MKIRLLSWNVNGLRAVLKKGFISWLKEESPDILCLQETKTSEEQIPRELKEIEGYHAYFSSAQRKGYSGVALYSRMEPSDIWKGFGIAKFDGEGRILIADYRDFILYNVYFPNGKLSRERLLYKLEFYDAFLENVQGFRGEGRSIIACGDFNTAHKEIDLARPRENQKVSGFLPEERAWIDRFIQHGFVDTFRIFNQEPGHYSWWDLKTRARERDIGWRIDYVFVSDDLRDKVSSAFILKEVSGSDHCPVGIELSL